MKDHEQTGGGARSFIIVHSFGPGSATPAAIAQRATAAGRAPPRPRMPWGPRLLRVGVHFVGDRRAARLGLTGPHASGPIGEIFRCPLGHAVAGVAVPPHSPATGRLV